MANKRSNGGSGGTSASPGGSADKGQASGVRGDVHLNSRDHSILEKAIRGSVARLIGASHPEFQAEPADREMPPELDVRLYPERDPLARQLPGTDRAIGYRKAVMAALVDPDPRSHRQIIEELQRAGIPIQTLAIQLFAPVAARLGNLWCSDDANLIHVAVASTRLGMIINHVSQSSNNAVQQRSSDRRVLLVRTRGAMHTIGVSLVATCFRDLGWEVDGGGDLEVDDDLFTRLSSTKYSLLGISVGRVDEAEVCSDAIQRIHANPVTKGTKVAIGGPAVLTNPKAFRNIGADIVAHSTLEVMRLADRMAY